MQKLTSFLSHASDEIIVDLEIYNMGGYHRFFNSPCPIFIIITEAYSYSKCNLLINPSLSRAYN